MEKTTSGELIIEPHDEVFVKIHAEPSTLLEMSERFTFFADGYRFSPKYKNGFWDGKIRLFNARSRTIYKGLVPQIETFCQDSDYEFINNVDDKKKEYTTKEVEDFVSSLNIPEKFEKRDYQIETTRICLSENRCLFVSPVNSGKSMMIYWLIRFYKKKTLLIVPRTALITQMVSDFEDYGFDTDKYIHTVFSGQDKNTDKQVVISTWQSIFKLGKEWFDQFDVVIGDEAHNYKAASLIKIMENSKAKYRFGFTGSLHETTVNKLTLEGLFGPVKQIITSRTMIDRGFSSELSICAFVLKYSDEIRQLNNKKRIAYEDEVAFLISYEKRNKFLTNIATNVDGNIICLFRFIDHGNILVEMAKKMTDRPIYLVSGQNSMEEKEYIRQIVNKEKNAILFASIGTFSEGISIPNLNYGLICHPSKAKNKLVQQIGRGLRKTKEKTKFTLIDVADDLSYKSKKNYTLEHFAERIRIYNLEKFDYKIFYKNI